MQTKSLCKQILKKAMKTFKVHFTASLNFCQYIFELYDKLLPIYINLKSKFYELDL